jgi:hypothetical protein
MTGVTSPAAREDLTMDAAGARALAQRIAQGKPRDEEMTASSASAATPGVEIVFVHPRLVERRPKVWMYVRGPDGHLRRAR